MHICIGIFKRIYLCRAGYWLVVHKAFTYTVQLVGNPVNPAKSKKKILTFRKLMLAVAIAFHDLELLFILKISLSEI